MATDRHPARRTFSFEGHPESYINVIEDRGVFARIMQARKCPCQFNIDQETGRNRKRRLCEVCKGDGRIHEFQRALLQADEDSPLEGCGSEGLLAPYRIPLIDVVSVESVPEMGFFYGGGYTRHSILEFGTDYIKIGGTPLPKKHQRKKVTYYFDRFEQVVAEQLTVDVSSKTLTATGTRETSISWIEIHGDIAIVDRLYNNSTGYEYKPTQYDFVKNEIYIKQGPKPVPGEIYADYWYCPVTRVAPADIRSEQKKENYMTDMMSGETRMTLLPWFRMGDGDLITLMTVELEKEDMVVRANAGSDALPEFDVSALTADILAMDQRGNLTRYRPGQHFARRRFNQIRWLTNKRPPEGTSYSVRYRYRPTFQVFTDQSERNNSENKQYPQIINVKLFSGAHNKDI